MDDERKPWIETGTLEYFRRLFPDQAPELKHTEREIWFNRGAAEVVRHMQQLHDIQHENILSRS